MRLLIAFIIICFASCTKYNTGHECPFKLCPYKGYRTFPGVINTGENKVDAEQEGSDTWAIDRLHFEYPNASYDELESILF